MEDEKKEDIFLSNNNVNNHKIDLNKQDSNNGYQPYGNNFYGNNPYNNSYGNNANGNNPYNNSYENNANGNNPYNNSYENNANGNNPYNNPYGNNVNGNNAYNNPYGNNANGSNPYNNPYGNNSYGNTPYNNPYGNNSYGNNQYPPYGSYSNNNTVPDDKSKVMDILIYIAMVLNITYLLWTILTRKFLSQQMYAFRSLVSIYMSIVYVVDSIMVYNRYRKLSPFLWAFFFNLPYPWVRANIKGEDNTIPKAYFFVSLFLAIVFVTQGIRVTMGS